MKKRSPIKNGLFANQHHQQTIDKLNNPLVKIETCIKFAHLAAEIAHVIPRYISTKDGRPPFPTETMVRILVLKRIYNLSDKQMEYPRLKRMSFKRFCGLTYVINIPDHMTVSTLENRIGKVCAKGQLEKPRTC